MSLPPVYFVISAKIRHIVTDLFWTVKIKKSLFDDVRLVFTLTNFSTVK